MICGESMNLSNKLYRFYNKCAGKSYKNVKSDILKFSGMIKDDGMISRDGIRGLQKIALKHPSSTQGVVNIFKGKAENIETVSESGRKVALDSLHNIATRNPKTTADIIETYKKHVDSDFIDISKEDLYHKIIEIGRACKDLHSLDHNSQASSLSPASNEEYQKVTDIALEKLFEYAEQDHKNGEALDSTFYNLNKMVLDYKPSSFDKAKSLLEKCDIAPEDKDILLEDMERTVLARLSLLEEGSGWKSDAVDPAFRGKETVLSFGKESTFFCNHEEILYRRNLASQTADYSPSDP